MTNYRDFDPQLWAAIDREADRQEHNVELIASENIASAGVRAAQGSILTNKYAEGYPNKRYYGGTEYIDQVEQLAIDRVKELFGAEYSRFQRAAHLADQILEDSYLQEPSERGYKEQRYAYALSTDPLPAWFVPNKILQYLEEIITAYGFLWFAVVDYAESRYYEQKGA